MQVQHYPEEKQVHISGCKEKLTFKAIDAVAKKENLKDYSIEENHNSEVLPGYSYKLKY